MKWLRKGWEEAGKQEVFPVQISILGRITAVTVLIGVLVVPIIFLVI